MALNSVILDGQEVFPSKIICVGRNYVEHIKELNNDIPTEPVIFLKPNSAIDQTLRCDDRDAIHYEAEICFLIKDGKLNGVGFGLDLTKRDLQTQLKMKGLPWERAKAFNSSAVFSEFSLYAGAISDLRLELWINGTIRQQANVDLMIHKPNDLLAEINTFISCEDNDIIMTGTPKGVGIVRSQDQFIGKIFASNTPLIELVLQAEF